MIVLWLTVTKFYIRPKNLSSDQINIGLFPKIREPLSIAGFQEELSTLYLLAQREMMFNYKNFLDNGWFKVYNRNE